MGSLIRWANSFLLVGTGLLLPLAAFPQGSPPQVSYPDTPRTYVPGSAQGTPAVQQQAQRAGPTNVGQIPTPDTAPAPDGSIIAPSIAAPPKQNSPGQYRNDRNEVKLEKMFLDRYKTSVVQVAALDLSGNVLSRAMGVGVGRNAQFIATPLSIVLGNTQQWADKIEITHVAGNKYFAKIALIDEEKNLVLLAPEASPAPIPTVRALDERPHVEVFMIGMDRGPEGGLSARITRGEIAAASQETGLLSVSMPKIDDSLAGTAIINTQGELVGMLLPGGRGVLTSTLQRLSLKAQKNEPIDPVMTGVILGRGVLVEAKRKGAYPTITAALEAINKGEAPKADTALFTPARNRTVAPKESDKVVVKVMPGTYKEAKTIALRSSLSLSGSGPGRTILVGADPGKPVLLLQDVENTIVSGFRITPAPLQQLKAPAVIVSKSTDVEMLGNVIEAKGGVGLWVHESQNVKVLGSTFARGQARGLSCDRSQMVVEANAFVGDWPMAFSADRNCSVELRRNLFFGNKVSVSVSALVRRVNVERNSFIRDDAAVKVTGSPKGLRLNDNLFFESPYGLLAGGPVATESFGRNAIWRTKMQAAGRQLNGLDLVRTEPKFVAPEDYDFRLQPGQSQLGNALSEPGADLGAFQRSDLLGPYTQQMVRTLGVAVGEEELAEAWGIE